MTKTSNQTNTMWSRKYFKLNLSTKFHFMLALMSVSSCVCLFLSRCMCLN